MDFIQSGGTSGGTYARYYTGKLSVWENSYDIVSNTSNVGYRLQLLSSSSGQFSGLNASFSITINGQQVKSGSGQYSLRHNSAITFAEGTITIGHNDDGTKTIGCSAVIDFQNHTYSPGDFTPSGNLTLSTIPRSSTINNFYGSDIEEYFSVNYTAHYNGFTNKLRISIPNVKELENFNYTSGQTFKLSSDTIKYLYEYMKNSKTVKIGAVIETWNGETKIGESVELINNCFITGCEPTIENLKYLDSNTETVKITGNNQQIIRNHSTLKIELTNLKSFKGATLSKCTATVNNITKSFSNITGTSIDSISLDFGTLNIAENTKVSLTLTDSRDYFVTKELNIAIINYIDLSINANVKRTQPTTGEVDLEFSGNYYNNKIGSVNNQLTMKWFYKESGTTQWIVGGNISPVLKNNTYSNGTSKISLGKIFDYQKSYEFYIKVADKLITLKPQYAVTQGIPVFNWGKDFFNVFGTLKIKGKNILELIYPVGSTYITKENINPNEILEFGTWERLKGKVCLGLDENDTDFNKIGKIGGEKTHKLTIEEMPNHGHDGTFWKQEEGYGNINPENTKLANRANIANVEKSGGDQAHNNLQPYEVVGYMWIRRK